MNWQFFVYMLRCSDGSFYTGIINDIDRRFFEHQYGHNEKCYTYKRRPLYLVLCEDYQYVNDAIAREKQIKRWSRKKKKALFRIQTERLQSYSKRNTAWTLSLKLRSSLRRRLTVMVRDALRCSSP